MFCPEPLPAALLSPMAVDIYEGHAGFLGEFLTAQDLLEQGLLEGLSCVAPQPVLTAGLGHHDTAQCVLGWGPVRHRDGQYLPYHRKQAPPQLTLPAMLHNAHTFHLLQEPLPCSQEPLGRAEHPKPQHLSSCPALASQGGGPAGWHIYHPEEERMR